MAIPVSAGQFSTSSRAAVIDPTSLQRGLNVLGYSLPITGLYGSQTRDAIRQYASRYNFQNVWMPSENTRNTVKIAPEGLVQAIATAAATYGAPTRTSTGATVLEPETITAAREPVHEQEPAATLAPLTVPGAPEAWYRKIPWWGWGAIGVGTLFLLSSGAKRARR